MSLKTVATQEHVAQLERLWCEIAQLQHMLGAHEEPEIPGLSGHDVDWDLRNAMLHIRRAQMRVRDVLGDKA